jgi:SH3-like domain-containing protein
MALEIGSITVIQAAADATGWRPEELPGMDGRETDGYVNLRAGPSDKAGVVAVLRPGVRVVVLGVEENGWTPVAALGWVSKELLKATG